ncbi:hypothetical protein FRC09_010493 [Ceratobasidium sp. 395]|nr:hypothetical protein FRC09_010493 [Ceratobasidium sp. 395]
MSQAISTEDLTAGQGASLAGLIVGHFDQQIVRPLEARFEAQNAQITELAAQNAQFQSSVLSILGSGGNPLPPPPSNTRGSRRRRESAIPKPDNKSAREMQDIVRRIIKGGCRIKHLRNAQLGLSDEELKDRIANDPDLPWRPDFMKLIDNPDNQFWVKKILDATMTDVKARKSVQDGEIAERFWTREIVYKRILGPMWNNTRKEVRQIVDERAAERGRINQSNTNKVARGNRLHMARMQLATGTDKRPRFQYRIDNVMRDIPIELMVKEAMSDVEDTQYDSEDIPREVPRDEYRAERPRFEYEGRPPFWRRAEPYNGIMAAMDLITGHKKKGFGIQPQYYAGRTTRGQRRDASPSRASEIPTSVLHRCHISKQWYDRLSPEQRNVLKRSPPGWEVDEERVPAELGGSS